MCRAMDTIYDVARLDVDADMNPRARIGGGSIVHSRRWRPIALSNVHRELQSNVVPQSFVQEIHYERQVRYDLSGGRNRSDRDCEYCVAKNASTSAHIIVNGAYCRRSPFPRALPSSLALLHE
jgi:hypothetical protein